MAIAAYEPNRALALRSSNRVREGKKRSLAHVDWVWAFVLDDLGDGRTRVILRMSSTATPWRAAVVRRLLAVPGEALRVRRLMSGLARRATSAGAAGAGTSW